MPIFLLSLLPYGGTIMLFIQIYRGKMFTGEKLRKPAQNALRQVPVWSFMLDAIGLTTLLFFLVGIVVWFCAGVLRIIFLAVLYSPWVSKYVFEVDLKKTKAEAENTAAMGQMAGQATQAAQEQQAGQEMEEQDLEEQEEERTAAIKSKKQESFQADVESAKNVVAFNQSARAQNPGPTDQSNVISMAPQHRPNPNSITSKKPANSSENFKKAA
ncbi:MAG TPA: hypothetical protein VEC13_02595 [Candidatus Paceibacterota bacterium]|nr:hypothetical protein [Candidatus Paceibacterota bacterium]